MEGLENYAHLYLVPSHSNEIMGLLQHMKLFIQSCSQANTLGWIQICDTSSRLFEIEIVWMLMLCLNMILSLLASTQ